MVASANPIERMHEDRSQGCDSIAGATDGSGQIDVPMTRSWRVRRPVGRGASRWWLWCGVRRRRWCRGRGCPFFSNSKDTSCFTTLSTPADGTPSVDSGLGLEVADVDFLRLAAGRTAAVAERGDRPQALVPRRAGPAAHVSEVNDHLGGCEQGRWRRRGHSRPRPLHGVRADQRGSERQAGADDARAFIHGDHAARLQPPVARRRRPHEGRHGCRAQSSCGLCAD